MFATAPGAISVWLLLECPEFWGANAVQDCHIAHDLKQWLSQTIKDIPGSRLQLIKQSRSPKDHITLFVVRAMEQEQEIRRYVVDSYEHLIDVDIAAIAAGTDVHARQKSEEPLFLVCTNGSRDACCGKWGVQAYTALAAAAGKSVWQTTHTGGHRFAATMICLPSGICYGRVEPGEVHSIVETAGQNQIYRLDRYRGRCCYDQTVQAADYFLRDRTGVNAASAYRFAGMESAGDQQWIVRFIQTEGGATHKLRITEERTASPMIVSCRSGKKEFLPRQALQDYQVES